VRVKHHSFELLTVELVISQFISFVKIHSIILISAFLNKTGYWSTRKTCILTIKQGRTLCSRKSCILTINQGITFCSSARPPSWFFVQTPQDGCGLAIDNKHAITFEAFGGKFNPDNQNELKSLEKMKIQNQGFSQGNLHMFRFQILDICCTYFTNYLLSNIHWRLEAQCLRNIYSARLQVFSKHQTRKEA